MGLGQIGGDGSVRWKIVHHKPDGTVQPLTHRFRRIGQVDTGAGDAQGDTNKVVVGNNGVGPNPANSDEAEAIDGIDIADVGIRVGAPGHFKVSLQYESQSEAEAALKAATVAGRSVVLLVPVVDRSGGANRGRANEVIVTW